MPKGGLFVIEGQGPILVLHCSVARKPASFWYRARTFYLLASTLADLNTGMQVMPKGRLFVIEGQGPILVLHCSVASSMSFSLRE